MPQDKRRSISYRSFVTCDDPKGVECGVIRKSKINNNSQKKEQDIINKVVEAERKQINQNKSVVVSKEESEKKEMGVVRGITRAELELEVSKETEKLNHVINAWSSSSSSSNDKLKKKNDNIANAKDLLRGALDLQDSLVMLGRLQEASSYMLGLSRKEKQKLEDGAFDVMVSGVRGSPRPRKSIDEMRDVVRDSLLRQNMISNPIFEENYDHRKMGGMASPDMLPSTSSSTQSSMVYSSNFVPSDSSVSSSTASRKKCGKDSNLIVRLMGLESFPSSPRKHVEKEKILNLAKPKYEIDSPRARRPQFGVQESVLKQKSVEEILERLKVKGLLKDTSVDGLTTVHSPESENYSSSYSWVDERPPIVVMKPIRYPCLDLDKPYKQRYWGEKFMKPGYSRESADETLSNEAINYSKKNEVARVDSEDKAKSIKKVASSKVKSSVNVKPEPQRKQTESKKQNEVEKVSPIRRKVEEKKDARSSDHQLNSRDQEKFSTAKNTRQKDGKSVSKNQSSNQQNATSNSVFDQRKRRTSERKKNRQPALEEEKRMCKGEIRESNVVDKEDSNDNEKCQIQIRDYDIDSQIKLLSTPDRYLCHPNDKNISHYDDSQSSYSEITSVSTSEYCNVDHLGETQSTLHEVTLITTHENGIAVHHETTQEVPQSLDRSPDNETLRPCHTPRTKLRALLLNNSLFVTHVEDLFNIQVSAESVPCIITDDSSDQDSESAQLLIDCANELLELKSSRFLQACLPLPRIYTTKLQSYFSLERLLEEVCNGIENLRLYSRPVKDDYPSEDLYALLDQDLEFKSRTWEVGWRNIFTSNEVEQIIGEVDKFILGNLIQEVLSDFML